MARKPTEPQKKKSRLTKSTKTKKSASKKKKVLKVGPDEYSPDFLEKMKERLSRMRKELLREVTKSMKEESNTLRFDVGDFYDHASEDMERDLALTLSNREREKLLLIDDALKRIDEGTYGFCDVTGEKIGEDRLMAMPFTKLSLEAQEEMERGEI